MNEQKKLFYGWYILAVSVLVMALCYAPVVSCASLFVTPITEEFGFARSAFTITKTIASLVGMAVAPFFGKIMAKKHMHAVWVGSLLGVTAVFTGMSFASTLPQFYIISFIQGLFTTSAAMLPVNIVLTNWFRKKRGFIVSIAMAGSGIGGTVLSRLMGTMIVEHGWRYTYRFLALLILCILVPAVVLVIRRTPVEKGLKPYGEEMDDTLKTERERQNAGKRMEKEWDASLKELRSLPVFWAYVFGIALIAFTSAVIIHIPSAVVDAGYTMEKAASISSLYLLIAVPGKMILGYIFDRFGVRAGIPFGGAVFLLSMLSLLVIQHPPVLYLMAVFFGFGACLSTVSPSIIASRTFGTKNYPEIFGVTTMLVNGGYAIGVPVIGLFYDMTGSYYPAWIVMGILAVLMTVSLLYSYQKSREYVK